MKEGLGVPLEKLFGRIDCCFIAWILWFQGCDGVPLSNCLGLAADFQVRLCEHKPSVAFAVVWLQLKPALELNDGLFPMTKPLQTPPVSDMKPRILAAGYKLLV